MARRAKVVVAGSHGDAPVVEPEVPWWAEARSLVAAAEAAVGAQLRVLRRLSVDSGENGRDSEVSYLFEREGGPRADEPDHPLRSPWARSGWLDEVLAWEPVAAVIAGRAVQEKWWNLSAVVEIPTGDGSVWLKAIPEFFADEGRIIDLLAREFPGRVPTLLGVGEQRALMGPIAGEDQWEADDATVEDLVTFLVEVQLWSTTRLEDFIACGARDRRAEPVCADFELLVSRADVRTRLRPEELDELDGAAAALPGWACELETCGLPVTLLHGDFHPGNSRGAPGQLVVLDWTDAAVGSALLDLPPLMARLSPERAAVARSRVTELWSGHRPGVDFDRAFGIAEVVRAAMDALTFRTFLDGIEPSEHPDHEADVPAALRRLLRAALRLTV